MKDYAAITRNPSVERIDKRYTAKKSESRRILRDPLGTYFLEKYEGYRDEDDSQFLRVHTLPVLKERVA
jgi:hypothetical protein